MKASKTWFIQDTRSVATKMQQRLWQTLGTLCRTRENLIAIRGSVTGEARADLTTAIIVIGGLIAETRAAMQDLPSKKKKALLDKRAESCILDSST